MFTTPLEKILEALAAIPALKTVDAWQGDIKELLEKVQKLPSAHLLLSLADFDEPQTLRGELNLSETTWSIVIISENLRDRKTGLVESLVLIEALLGLNDPSDGSAPGLTRLDTGRGRLWPAQVQFLGADGGKAAYGIKFYNKKGH